jgi:acyl-CoA synthetase (AMP-forming)/AMP-acid ligase II
VTFALPHPKLGEEVAAAVVLREGETADERDIRDFAASGWPTSRCRARW